jgi:hypothetical protein
MYNSNMPSPAELPTSGQLIRSTLIALVSAIVLLFTVVLPSEYAVDPTGIGRVLGLTEMGEIKTRLEQEAVEDAAAKVKPLTQQTPVTPSAAQATNPASANAPSTSTNAWRDGITFTLAPGQGTEIKLSMAEGDKAIYAWRVEGGVVNYDTHGDDRLQSISYSKGRGVASDEGELVAAFTGSHGWFWRNRGDADVTVSLKTGGAYADIKRAK